MAHPASKALFAILAVAGLSSPALAQNYGAFDRSDSISIGAGDAPAANIAIQTPTPWPYYVNNTDIHGIGVHGEDVISNFYDKYKAPPATIVNSTTVNVTSPGQ